jgi:hypothetical protein
VHLLSYGDGAYAARLAAFRREAERFGLFDEMRLCSETDLDASFWEAHGEFVRANPRGGGYWLWKPFLIAQTLRQMPAGAVLAYVDLGCIINSGGRARFLEYVETVRSTPPHVLSAVLPDDSACTDAAYCKPDVLAHFGLPLDGEVATARQRKATFMLVCKQRASEELIDRWLSTCTARDYALLDDTYAHRAAACGRRDATAPGPHTRSACLAARQRWRPPRSSSTGTTRPSSACCASWRARRASRTTSTRAAPARGARWATSRSSGRA